MKEKQYTYSMQFIIYTDSVDIIASSVDKATQKLNEQYNPQDLEVNDVDTKVLRIKGIEALKEE